MIGAALALMRPVEWLKNVLVLAPLLFAGLADEGPAVVDALLAFAAFCLMASAGYALNDARDAELDRDHPVKRRRPVASGALTPPQALAIAGLLALAALGCAALVRAELIAVVAGYGALTAAYSLALKTLVIVDVMTIAGCFLLRVIGGTVAIDVEGSSWLFVCTGSAALFLGFTKRRQEALSEAHDGRRSRPVLEHYTVPFLDQMVSLVTAMAIISYTIYATESPIAGDEMLLSVPPVLYALFRYLYLIYDRRRTEDAAQLILGDAGMLAASVTWLVVVLVLIQTA
jgi:4-hydroxybenzoate polyprenyltransferase